MGPAAATLLGDQPLSGLRRRRGSSTGTACWGPGFPGEGSASGGAPGGLAPMPLGCSPEACSPWASLDITARLEEGGDGSLGRKCGRRPREGSGLLPDKAGSRSHSTEGALGEKGRHQVSQDKAGRRSTAGQGRLSLGEERAQATLGQDRPYWEHCEVRRAWAPCRKASCCGEST